MKGFLFTCIGLMIVAGIYGATDMTRDIKNDRLIDYEHVRERHAKHILAIIKTTNLGTYKFRGRKTNNDSALLVTRKVQKEEVKEKKMVEYFEEFSRGDE